MGRKLKLKSLVGQGASRLSFPKDLLTSTSIDIRPLIVWTPSAALRSPMTLTVFREMLMHWRRHLMPLPIARIKSRRFTYGPCFGFSRLF